MLCPGGFLWKCCLVVFENLLQLFGVSALIDGMFAGVMACPKTYTKDGFEMQIGTNHVSIT
jgi:hypothetical protein